MELLVKVESISGPQFDLKDYYVRVLNTYGRDLETVRKLYQKQKNEPVTPRNLPPIAGKIAWARQLYRRIEAPMKVFKKKPEILKVSQCVCQRITNNALLCSTPTNYGGE